MYVTVRIVFHLCCNWLPLSICIYVFQCYFALSDVYVCISISFCRLSCLSVCLYVVCLSDCLYFLQCMRFLPDFFLLINIYFYLSVCYISICHSVTYLSTILSTLASASLCTSTWLSACLSRLNCPYIYLSRDVCLSIRRPVIVFFSMYPYSII